MTRHTNKKFRFAVWVLMAFVLRGPEISFSQIPKEGDDLWAPEMYSPEEKPFGLSQADWGVKWIDYLLSFDCGTFPVLSTTGIGAEAFQDGPVYFLSGSIGGKIQRSITVPAGKALFIPLVTYLNHYPCPYPGFEPAPGQSMLSFLIEGAAKMIDGAAQMEVIVDGHVFADLEAHRFISDLFYLKANPELVCIDMCITTGPQPSIVDGYWIILKPLPPGQHDIRFYAEVPGHGMVVDVRYDVIVL